MRMSRFGLLRERHAGKILFLPQAECLVHKLYIRIRHPHYYILNDNREGSLEEGCVNEKEICFFIAEIHIPAPSLALPGTRLIKHSV